MKAEEGRPEGAEPDPGALDQAQLEALHEAFLQGLDEGRDLSPELLARAGARRADLEAKIRLELELRELSRAGTPRRLGRFRVLELLGQGGISRVFRAHDPELGRKIALKVLTGEVLLDKDQRAWNLNEARSLARLDHPHVVKVFEVGEDQAQAYIAMELLTGPSLDDVIREWKRQRDGGGSPPSAAVTELALRHQSFSARIELLAVLAEALAYCHDHGILHRDIKPKNVLFDASGAPCLIDFGLAHVKDGEEDSSLGLTQALVGTAAYIAPEQVTSDRTGADPRSDQFSFATLAYECFALENPFLRKSRHGILAAVEAADPEPLRRKVPAIPPALATVIGHAHAADPARRYAGLGALAADLRAILAHRPVSVEEASLFQLGRLWLRRHRRGVRAVSASLGATLLLVSAGWYVTARSEREELLATLAQIGPEAFVGPVPFDASFKPLLELRQRARDFDAGVVRSALLGAVSPEVDLCVHAWAAGLGQNYERDLLQNQETNSPLQELLYRRLFAKEEVLCEECTENLEYRRRGTVHLPLAEIGGRESRLEYALPRMPKSDDGKEFDSYSVFGPTEFYAYLLPGAYRLQVWKDGATELDHEIVFLVQDGWHPEVRVELRKPRFALWNEARAVERSSWPLKSGPKRLRVASFRILPRLVTVAEYREFLRECGPRGEFRDDPPLPADAVAPPDLVSAMAFAAWVGGRLPLSQEVYLARRERAIDPLNQGAGGEFLLDVSPAGTKHQYLSYDRNGMLKLVIDSQKIFGEGGSESEPAVSVGFRVVFPTDSPEFYRELVAEPHE